MNGEFKVMHFTPNNLLRNFPNGKYILFNFFIKKIHMKNMGQPDLTRPDPQSDWPEPVFNPLKMTNDMIDPQPDWPDSTRTDPPVLPSLKLYVIGFFFLFFFFNKENNMYFSFEKSCNKLLDVKCITLNSSLISRMNSVKLINTYSIILKWYKS